MKQKNITKQIISNYDNLTRDEAYIAFLETSVKAFAESGQEQFVSTFTEFGEHLPRSIMLPVY